MTFNWPITIDSPNAYCGINYLCTEGAEQVFGFLFILAILGTVFILGVYFGEQNDL